MKVLDLFSGAGGASLGLHQAGLKTALAVDSWKVACDTYRANFPEAEVLCAKMEVVDPATLPRADFIWGSPPCPDFSVANTKRNPERGMVLVRRFLEIVEAVRPRLGWCMENVPGVLDYLEPNGHRAVVLDAADHGVPQHRRRAFVGRFRVPRPTHGPKWQQTLDGQRLKPWVTVRQALGLGGTIGQPVRSLRHLAEWEKARNPFGDPDIDPRSTDEPSGSVTSAGVVHTELAIAVQGPGTHGRKNAVPLRLDAPSPTVIDGHHDKREPLPGYRRLEPYENAVLQGFPSTFKFSGSKTSQYRMIGNAVPPPVARAIAEATVHD